MIIEQTERPCARDGCRCQVHESKRYCSDHCREPGRDTTGRDVHEGCACGHAACTENSVAAEA
jgi:hypothetical protein